MYLKGLKTLAIAATAVLVLSGAAMAARLDDDTNLYKLHPGWGPAWSVDEGDRVSIYGCDDGYCYVRIRGKKGFVDADDIDFDNHGNWRRFHGNGFFFGGPGGYHGNPGVCAGGPGGKFCLNF